MEKHKNKGITKRLISIAAAAALFFGNAHAAAAAQPVYTANPDGSYAGPLSEDSAFDPLQRSGLSPEAARTNTVMIYMNGTNLESGGGYGTDDMFDMLESGFDPSISNVLVYAGGCSGWHSSLKSDVNSVVRIESGGIRLVTTSQKNSDMGLPRTLADFINFSTEYFPASHYALILWDHGGGPLLGFGNDDFFFNNMYNYTDEEISQLGSYGFSLPNDGLSLKELDEAMQATPFAGDARLDFVMYNACLIASVEAACVWSRYADRLVSSEESISCFGVPYSFLKEMDTSPLSQLPQSIVQTFGTEYEQINRMLEESDEYSSFLTHVDATMSSLDLTAAGALTDALDRLFLRAQDGLKRGQFQELRAVREQMYEFEPDTAGTDNCYDLVDCSDMAEKLAALYPEEAAQLLAAVDELVECSTTNVDAATGIMLYYPQHALSMDLLLGADVLAEIPYSQEAAKFFEMQRTIFLTGDPLYWWEEADETGGADGQDDEVQEEAPAPQDETEEVPETDAAAQDETEEVPVTDAAAQDGTEEVPGTDAATQDGTEEVPETNAAPTAIPEEDLQDVIVWQIPAELQDDMIKVTYSIYQEQADGTMRPVLLGITATPDSSGSVHILSGQRALCLSSDVTSSANFWAATEVSRSDGSAEYRVERAIMAIGPEFLNVTEDGQPFSTILVTAGDGANRAYIKTIKPAKTAVEPVGFDDIFLSDWEGLYEALASYEPVILEDGKAAPFSKWNATGDALFHVMPFEGQIELRMRKLSELAGNFVCVISVFDQLGNESCSEPLPFRPLGEANFTQETLETPGGTLTFSVFADHAELIRYEGGDEALAIPGEVDGVPVTAVGRRAIYGNDTIAELTFPDSVETIGEHACSYMSRLETLTFGSGLRRIEYRAFSNDSSLTDLTIPEGTVSIGRAAFQRCEELESVALPASLEALAKAAFGECPALRDIDVPDDCVGCQKNSNLILTADGKTLLAVPEGAGTYVKIPEGVETIAYGAFSGAGSIKMVEIPESVTRIENCAFIDCPGLVNLTLPSNLEYLGARAFGISNSLFAEDVERAEISSISLGAKVRTVGSGAFEGLALTEILVDDGNPYYASQDGVLTNKAGDRLVATPAAR